MRMSSLVAIIMCLCANSHCLQLSTVYDTYGCPPPAVDSSHCSAHTLLQVLDALPECGQYEVRLSHRALLEATVASLALPKEGAASAMALLSTATSASPAHPGARDKGWPSIRAGLDGLGLDAGPVSRCRQCVLQLPGGERREQLWVQTVPEVAAAVVRQHESHPYMP